MRSSGSIGVGIRIKKINDSGVGGEPIAQIARKNFETSGPRLIMQPRLRAVKNRVETDESNLPDGTSLGKYSS